MAVTSKIAQTSGAPKLDRLGTGVSVERRTIDTLDLASVSAEMTVMVGVVNAVAEMLSIGIYICLLPISPGTLRRRC